MAYDNEADEFITISGYTESPNGDFACHWQVREKNPRAAGICYTGAIADRVIKNELEPWLCGNHYNPLTGEKERDYLNKNDRVCPICEDLLQGDIRNCQMHSGASVCTNHCFGGCEYLEQSTSVLCCTYSVKTGNYTLLPFEGSVDLNDPFVADLFRRYRLWKGVQDRPCNQPEMMEFIHYARLAIKKQEKTQFENQPSAEKAACI